MPKYLIKRTNKNAENNSLTTQEAHRKERRAHQKRLSKQRARERLRNNCASDLFLEKERNRKRMARSRAKEAAELKHLRKCVSVSKELIDEMPEMFEQQKESKNFNLIEKVIESFNMNTSIMSSIVRS